MLVTVVLVRPARALRKGSSATRVHLAIFVGLALSSSAPAVGEWKFVNLDPLRIGTRYSSSFIGAADDGQLVGALSTGNSTHAIAWSGPNAPWVDLHPSAAGYSVAYGGGGGMQVGYASIVGQQQAALWRGTAESWVNLRPDGYYPSSIAYDTDGLQQVGSVNNYDYDHASLWTGSAASWVNLHPTAYANSKALRVAKGQQVGWVEVGPSRPHASLWRGSASSWVDLNPTGAYGSELRDTDGSQQAGVTYMGTGLSDWGPAHASLWSGSAETWVDLHPQWAQRSEIIAMDSGYQLGTVFLPGDSVTTVRHGLWHGSADSWVDLSSVVPSTYEYAFPKDVWSDGELIYVVGFAQLRSQPSTYHAVMWVAPVPEPATLLALGAGLTSIVVRRRITKANVLGG